MPGKTKVVPSNSVNATVAVPINPNPPQANPNPPQPRASVSRFSTLSLYAQAGELPPDYLIENPTSHYNSGGRNG